jgi:hypothetical protein
MIVEETGRYIYSTEWSSEVLKEFSGETWKYIDYIETRV